MGSFRSGAPFPARLPFESACGESPKSADGEEAVRRFRTFAGRSPVVTRPAAGQPADARRSDGGQIASHPAVRRTPPDIPCPGWHAASPTMRGTFPVADTALSVRLRIMLGVLQSLRGLRRAADGVGQRRAPSAIADCPFGALCQEESPLPGAHVTNAGVGPLVGPYSRAVDGVGQRQPLASRSWLRRTGRTARRRAPGGRQPGPARKAAPRRRTPKHASPVAPPGVGLHRFPSVCRTVRMFVPCAAHQRRACAKPCLVEA